jgi:hypothetical protein
MISTFMQRVYQLNNHKPVSICIEMQNGFPVVHPIYQLYVSKTHAYAGGEYIILQI